MLIVKKNPNGVTTVSEQLLKSNIIALNVAVKNGSRHETVHNNGISHFLEHMAFKGTESRSALQIAEEFDSIGGISNAYTSRTETVYYTKVLQEYESQMYAVMADILNNSVFLAKEMDLEREVIIQEIKMQHDSPDDVLYGKMFQNIYKNQSLGLQIIGTENNVKKFQKTDLFNFHKNNYFNANTVVSIVGDFDQNKFTDEFVSKFNNDRKVEKPDFQSARFCPTDLHTDKDLEQVQMIICFEGVSYHDDDYWVCKILAVILGGGMSSRLFQELREKKGLTYNISTFPYCFSDGGLFVIHACLEPKNMSLAIDLIIQQLHAVMHAITASELSKAKAQYKSALFMSAENSDVRAERLSNSILRYGKNINICEVLEKINKVTAQSVINFAKTKLLTDKIGFFTLGKLNERYSYEKILAKLKK